MKDDPTTTTTTTTCNQCNLLDPKLLHHIRINGTFRRLCTTCVLRLHPKHFCPTCLTVYHRSPPDHAVVCHKCQSYSHRTCVSPFVAFRTPCATCVNPNGIIFNPRSPVWRNNSNRMIDLCSARLLVAAAEISSVSMGKAEAAAVMEAEWRAKEASEWWKKAKEAVNHVVKLREIEKKKRDDNVDSSGSIGVSEALNAVKLEDESMCTEW